MSKKAKPEEAKKTEEAPKEEKPAEEAEKPVAKVEKPKPEKKKKIEKKIYTLYKVEGDKAVRLRPTCERCGVGYFMADHKNRFTCGHCGFTRYKPVETLSR